MSIQIGASRTINRGGVQLGASARGEQEGEYNMKSKQIQLLIHFIKGKRQGEGEKEQGGETSRPP